MIEVTAITPTLIISLYGIHIKLGEMIYDSRSLAINMICVSFTLLTGLLTNWVLTVNNTKIFKNELINIGNIRIFYLIFEHK